jgi:hypothetical protein
LVILFLIITIICALYLGHFGNLHPKKFLDLFCQTIYSDHKGQLAFSGLCLKASFGSVQHIRQPEDQWHEQGRGIPVNSILNAFKYKIGIRYTLGDKPLYFIIWRGVLSYLLPLCFLGTFCYSKALLNLSLA